MLWRMKQVMQDERGQGTLEYVLIIGIIVVVLFGILFLARKPLMDIMSRATNAIKAWFGSAEPVTADEGG